jgi:hypothetical protein
MPIFEPAVHSPAATALGVAADHLRVVARGLAAWLEEHPDGCKCKTCQRHPAEWREDLKGIAWQAERGADAITCCTPTPMEFEAIVAEAKTAGRKDRHHGKPNGKAGRRG